MRRLLTVHGNASHDALAQMLLLYVSYVASSGLALLTATSKISFWPLLVVVKALRIGGSCSVSNLTAIDISAISRCAVQWLGRGAPIAGSRKRFSRQNIPSTTAPMTAWILPSLALLAASVLANRVDKAGRRFFLMGWKARCTVAGRASEARRDRWRPLFHRISIAFIIN
jgi:hypothetical protein